MAFQFMGFIYVSRAERRAWKDDPIQFRHIYLHEKAHADAGVDLIFRSRKDEELRAELTALMIIIKERRLSIDQAVRLEVDYRLWRKYGVTLNELKRILNKLKGDVKMVKKIKNKVVEKKKFNIGKLMAYTYFSCIILFLIGCIAITILGAR